ncbi:hypothetical protein C9I92_15155 [Photobacterium ganghwense]|uniref:Uncharacterized protein n=1 Tax=Photobacterium ganghwense TaxID=320778 RepID=A0A0J1H8F5_9GAMM|nr:hypothetical protein [Photobacterium ganghwense]KLV07983.1 hypothetical protein ABT57_14140 [Photobacterium ganghwense]PSU07090.1 hypothetical protein C9I92_15155 [Photobacterium ganghwense]QSV15846.1 hypothetical protein FH974_21575 [Photobacterium ganghwense]
MAHSISWQAIDFIVEALAAKTYGEDRTEVGVYLVELVMKDRKKPLDAAQMKMVKAMLSEASDVCKNNK